MSWAAGELLDAIAAAVFEGSRGRARLDPLLARFDTEVGKILDDDAHRETLLAVRLDWALCDAPIEGGAGPGDTWLRRAVAGRIEGVEPEAEWRAALSTHVGLFEVWSGRRPFLRDRIGGLCVTLADPIHVEPPTTAVGPAALWEVRVSLHAGGVHLCRDPLPYPEVLAAWLEERSIARFAPGGAPASLVRLRRHWLQFSRARRADPMAFFGRD